MLPHITPRKVIALAVALAMIVYVIFSGPPAGFPKGTIVTVPSGSSLSTITSQLKSEHVIYSSFLFRSAVIILGGEKKVIAGDYLLDKPETVFSLALRFVDGNFHLNLVKVTLPEGWDTFQISDYLGTKLTGFATTTFIKIAQPQEGYLFPDTYFFSPIVTPQKVIDTMKANFDMHLALVSQVKTFGKPLKNIITMASIVEAEAKTTADRKIVAGILWKRISLGMPLQVDSTFLYINGKNTYELTDKDLKIDSPYNTYVYAGLPPGPINNPGSDSITATVNPTQTGYLYYFSDKQSVLHYAVTFEEHKKNRALYGGK